MFTCATDTGKLIWNVDGHNDVFYDSSVPEHKEQSVSIFNFNLISSIGNHLVSTATACNVDNDTEISCSDDVVPLTSNTDTKSVILSGNNNYMYYFII